MKRKRRAMFVATPDAMAPIRIAAQILVGIGVGPAVGLGVGPGVGSGVGFGVGLGVGQGVVRTRSRLDLEWVTWYSRMEGLLKRGKG